MYENVSPVGISKKPLKSGFVFDLLAFENKKTSIRDFSAAAYGSGGEQLSLILMTDLDRYFSHLPMVKKSGRKNHNKLKNKQKCTCEKTGTSAVVNFHTEPKSDIATKPKKIFHLTEC